jgi:CRISPR-associated protein Csy2
VVTIGEFKMPHSIKSIDEILWRYQTDQTNNLYLCTQNQKITQTEEEIENAYYA